MDEPQTEPDLASAELFTLVQQMAGFGVWSWDVATNVVTWSEELFRIYAQTPDTFRPSFEGYLELVHPADRDEVERTVREALKHGRRFSFDERIVRPDGTVRMLESLGTVLRDDDGAAIQMIGACMDVTEQRAVQSRLAHQDRLSALGTLAAGVAHELNNPLFYVRASIEHLQDVLAEPPLDVQEMLDDMLQGVDRMARIVDDLRAPRTHTNAGPVGVADAARTALSIVDHELHHRARVERDLDPSVFVRADAGQIQQIVLHLLTNAAQAIPSGRASDNTVAIRVAREGTDAVVTVADTGRGLPKGDPSRLFDPFVTTKPIGQGTGLGLFITHGVVTSLGGQIVLERRDQGTRATVRLPAVERSGQLAERSPALPLAKRRVQVLVVDDDPYIGRALGRLLREHDVVVVTSARDAMATLSSGLQPDLVLCDLMMPDGLGSELYAEIVRRWPRLAPRVRFITGGAFTPEVSEFAEAHAHLTLYKPISRARLMALLAETVS